MEYLMNQIRGFHAAYQRMLSEYKNLGDRLIKEQTKGNTQEYLPPNTAPNSYRRPPSSARTQTNSAPSRKTRSERALKFIGIPQNIIPITAQYQDGILLDYAGESDKAARGIISQYDEQPADFTQFDGSVHLEQSNTATDKVITDSCKILDLGESNSLDLTVPQHSVVTFNSAPCAHETRPITHSEVNRILKGKEKNHRVEIDKLKQELALLKNKFDGQLGNAALPNGILYDLR